MFPHRVDICKTIDGYPLLAAGGLITVLGLDKSFQAHGTPSGGKYPHAMPAGQKLVVYSSSISCIDYQKILVLRFLLELPRNLIKSNFWLVVVTPQLGQLVPVHCHGLRCIRCGLISGRVREL